MAFRIIALALALRSAPALKPPRLKLKLPTTPRRVATLEPPPLVVDTEPRTNLREASPLLPVTPLLTTRQLDESNETPTHWRRAARVQRSLMRFAPLALVGALLTMPKTLDAGVATLWSKLYGTWWAHAPMFEAWTATLGFVGAIAFWSSIHVLFFRDRRRASEFRFDKDEPVAPFEWLGQLGFKRLWGAYLPLVAYVGSIKLFHCVVTKAPLPMAPPTALRVLLELVTGVYLYDALFAPIHASMHKKGSPAWWRRLHRTHHEARPTERRGKALVPLETVQHSYADGALQVACNVLVQRAPSIIWVGGGFALAPKHPLSRVLHNLVVTYLLAEAHSGYDLPWMTHRAWPRVFGGAKAHDAHHVQGDRHFHQFFHSSKPTNVPHAVH
jgi:sterol desaturase/sphingolipid hydroxylase (fatty acid hydroxylase superfamily)